MRMYSCRYSSSRGATLLELLFALALVALIAIAAYATYLGLTRDLKAAPPNVKISGVFEPPESSIEVGKTRTFVLTVSQPNTGPSALSLVPVVDTGVSFRVVPGNAVTILSINGLVINADTGAANTDAKGQIAVVVRADHEPNESDGGIICVVEGRTVELARAKFEIFTS